MRAGRALVLQYRDEGFYEVVLDEGQCLGQCFELQNLDTHGVGEDSDGGIGFGVQDFKALDEVSPGLDCCVFNSGAEYGVVVGPNGYVVFAGFVGEGWGVVGH